jgi:coenzyme Q-binding protein COQ10
MTTVEHSVFINASSDEIDAVTLDAWRLPEWYVGIEEAVPDDLYPEPGGVAQLVYKVAGATFDITMTAIELTRGEGAAYRMEGMINGTNRWTYAPEGDGFWVTATFEYEMPGGVLGQIADRMVVEKMNAENLAESLERLKAVVEG